MGTILSAQRKLAMKLISLAAICVAAATRSNLTYFSEDCDVEGGNRAALKCKDIAKKRHQNCAEDCESEGDDNERQSCRLDCSLKWISDLEDCPCGENCMAGCPCGTEFGAKFCSTASADGVFMTKQCISNNRKLYEDCIEDLREDGGIEFFTLVDCLKKYLGNYNACPGHVNCIDGCTGDTPCDSCNALEEHPCLNTENNDDYNTCENDAMETFSDCTTGDNDDRCWADLSRRLDHCPCGQFCPEGCPRSVGDWIEEDCMQQTERYGGNVALGFRCPAVQETTTGPVTTAAATEESTTITTTIAPVTTTTISATTATTISPTTTTTIAPVTTTSEPPPSNTDPTTQAETTTSSTTALATDDPTDITNDNDPGLE